MRRAALLLACAGPAMPAQVSSSVGIDGQLQFDHAGFDGVYTNSGARRTATYLRRARLGATWNPTRDWRFAAELEADGHGSSALRTATVAWRGLPAGTLTVGRFDPDFGLEQAISSKATTAIERSAIWDLAPDVAESLKGVGVQWAGAGAWHFVSIGGYDKPGVASGVARIALAPLASRGRALHFGVSLARERVEAGNGRIRTRLGVRGVSEHADGRRVTLARAGVDGAFPRERSRVVEFAFASGPGSVQAEWLQRRLSGPGGQRTAAGDYLQLAWTVTGEARPYDVNGARFKTIEPANHPRGAWELFYRHDRLRVGEAGSAPARVHTLGVNWYATDALRLSVNGLQARAANRTNDAGHDAGRALGARLQWVF